MRIGIIGAGRFGLLLQKQLSTDNEVELFDRADNKQPLRGCELVILAVPNQLLESVVQEAKPYIAPRATVMDVGSVKVRPCEILNEAFGDNVLGTHPLFGPDSAAESWKNHKMVFCRLNIGDEAYTQVQDLFTSRGVEIIEITADEHDQMMAQTQAVVHFIGRALAGIKEQKISTPNYDNLLKMMNMVTNDTWELFFDMQNLNPYAEEVRQNFIQQLTTLEGSIQDDKAHRTAD